jgi:hypothetical protein
MVRGCQAGAVRGLWATGCVPGPSGWQRRRAGPRLLLPVDSCFRGNDEGEISASAAKRGRPGGLFITLFQRLTNRTADEARSAELTC